MRTETKTPSYAAGLEQLRSQLLEMLPADALEIFDRDAKQLEQTHQSILKIRAGDTAPDFILLNATGKTTRLYELLKNRRVVLTFYRGSWCPYCNLQLNQYQQVLDKIHATGAVLVAISPQTPDESLNMREKNALAFEVLSDNGNQVAKKYTTVFKNSDGPMDTMVSLGIDFNAHYSDDSGELPVPAVFIIEKNAQVSFASASGGDYRKRVEASEILTALQKEASYEK